jgi:ABC-type glycerol-3-phosphate transport system substrate-binding protein
LQIVLDLTKKYGVNAELGAELPQGLELDYSAFMLTGIWMLSSGAFRESFEQFGYEKMGHIRFPYGFNTDYSRNEGGAGGGSATPVEAPTPDNAWIWHKWNFNEYCKVGYTNFHSQAPARKSLAADPDYLASFASFESVDEWNYALETTVSLPVPNNGSEAINLMMAEWERVMLGEITVEEMVATVNPQMNELIKDTPPA